MGVFYVLNAIKGLYNCVGEMGSYEKIKHLAYPDRFYAWKQYGCLQYGHRVPTSHSYPNAYGYCYRIAYRDPLGDFHSNADHHSYPDAYTQAYSTHPVWHACGAMA